jgi:hypothetical protein
MARKCLAGNRVRDRLADRTNAVGKADRLIPAGKTLTVIASEAKQSRVRAADSGLLRRLRLLAMTGQDFDDWYELRRDAFLAMTG